MDEYNIMNMKRFFGKSDKLFLLLKFAGINRDISDPWYTGNFTQTYNDVMLGIEYLYEYIIKEN